LFDLAEEHGGLMSTSPQYHAKPIPMRKTASAVTNATIAIINGLSALLCGEGMAGHAAGTVAHFPPHSTGHPSESSSIAPLPLAWPLSPAPIQPLAPVAMV
jgi:hypothetical protein